MSTQTEQVIETIIQQIDDGAALPGQTLSENLLMEQCAVSRTPVREAFIKLEAEGLLTRNPRKGAAIFQPTIAEFLAILEVHSELEGHAAKLAARRITPGIAEEMKASVAACTAHAAKYGADKYEDYYCLNRNFHAIVARGSCNPVLLDLIRLNGRKLMAYYRLRYRYPGVAAASAREHEVIADHILNHRSEDAYTAMTSHFDYSRQTVMDLIASGG